MNSFEKKYGIKEDEAVKKFHKSRRMFCIVDSVLHIAEPNVSYSHAVWFENKGWMNAANNTFMDTVVRGIVDAKGDIYFYVGYDFHINESIEKIFFLHLKELVKQLNNSIHHIGRCCT